MHDFLIRIYACLVWELVHYLFLFFLKDSFSWGRTHACVICGSLQRQQSSNCQPLPSRCYTCMTLSLVIFFLFQIDEDATVGVDAFSRIAPAVPIISNVIISENLFEVLTMTTGGRLQFSSYDKYLIGLERYRNCSCYLIICYDKNECRFSWLAVSVKLVY